MRNLKMIQFEGREVTVKEMTPRELDGLLGGEFDDVKQSALDLTLAQHMVTGRLLAQATGVPVEEMEQIAPSRLKPLVEAFKEVNPDFFAGTRLEMGRLAGAISMLESSLGAMSTD